MTILLCTSLRPSPRTRTFCNDLEASSSEFKYFSRGKSGLAHLSAYARSMQAERLWIVSSRFGDPKLLDCYRVAGPEPEKIASFLMARIELRREISGLGKTDVRHRRLRLMPTDSPSLSRLHDCVSMALGSGCSCGAGATEIHLIERKDFLAELFFIDGISKLPCGPAFKIKTFRCNA